jgi:fluoroacetyl-CoA thioesterase
MEFSVGATADVTHAVAEADTATAFGSGDVPVLATPRVLALLEEATVAAVAPSMADGQTTVGTRISLEHQAPTPVGRTVTASARLVAVDGRRLEFEVTLTDGATVAAFGTVERIVVDRARFIARAAGG